MSQDRRGDGVQVVGGSNPPCPTKTIQLRSKDLTPTASPTVSPVSGQVSNRASNRRREEIVSRRLERDDSRAGVCLKITHRTLLSAHLHW